MVAASALLVSVIGSAAVAQTQRGYKDPLAPKTSSGDRKLQKFFSRGVPQTKTDRAARRLLNDPLRKLGLPENRLNDPKAATVPGAAPPVFESNVRHLDADGDGSVSRTEYFQGRTRLVSPGRNTARRNRAQQRRLDSRFRQADSNRDGRVSPAELKATGGVRF
jgi:hypothetical protein